METYEAIYENGKVIFKDEPNIKKAKILVTFVEIMDKKDKFTFPTRKLGKIKYLNRERLYEDYLSNRY